MDFSCVPTHFEFMKFKNDFFVDTKGGTLLSPPGKLDKTVKNHIKNTQNQTWLEPKIQTSTFPTKFIFQNSPHYESMSTNREKRAIRNSS